MTDMADTGLELYHSDYSTCSQKVRLVLAEKGLAFTSHQIDFRTKDHLAPAYLKLNPNGVVPTLVHNGRVVIDSSVIMEYLDEVFPTPALSPADPVARAAMRAWLRYIEEVPTPAVRYPSFQKVFVKAFQHMSAEEFDREARERPLRTHFYRKMGRDGFADAEYQAALDDLRQTGERIDAAMAKGPWMNGADYSLADAAVTPSIDRMVDLGLGDLWQDLPGFQDWWRRIRERPNFAKAYYPGSRISERRGQGAAAALGES